MNPRSSERGHTRGGTLNRRLRALAVVAFGLALLPGAIAVDTSPAPSTPVVATRLDPVPPLRAEKPTRDEQINLNARRRVAERPEHFQCLGVRRRRIQLPDIGQIGCGKRGGWHADDQRAKHKW